MDDGDQVGGQETQTDPALDAVAVVIGSTAEAIDAAEDTDAALAPGAPVVAPSEPALPLTCPAGGGRRSGLG